MPNIKKSNKVQTQAIGLFDSGVGGLSIWRAVKRILPNEHTIYLADNQNAPYGEKSKDEIIALSEKNTEFLLNQNVKLIIVACNTASTNAIPHLRRKYKVPFIRIQPAIKPAGLQSKTKVIGLLATKATLKSTMLNELKQIIPTQDIEIIGQYGKGLVEIVENVEMEQPQTYRLLERYLIPMMAKNIDQLVLGCTHYPFLIPQMQKILGDNVQIIDPALPIARQTKRILTEFDLLAPKNQKAKHYFYANKSIKALQIMLKNYSGIIIKLIDF